MTVSGRARLVVCLVLAAGFAACDLSPTVDVDTPAFEERLAVRSVLAVGRTAAARVGIARDPFAVADSTQPSIADATVTLWRGADLVEELPFRSQTCFRGGSGRCNPETGVFESIPGEPFECGDYRGALNVEPGEVTLRVERAGLPTAEATVVVPEPPEGTFAVRREGDGYAFDVSVVDDPAPGSRYGISLLREFDAVDTQVCAVGGPRDTTVVLANPGRYTTSYGTDDPVLRAASADLDDSVNLIVFDDAAFSGGVGQFTMRAPLVGRTNRRGTGGFTLQLARLSPVFYDYLRETLFPLDAPTPFDEPANLPSNVTGGYGHVGAIATREIAG